VDGAGAAVLLPGTTTLGVALLGVEVAVLGVEVAVLGVEVAVLGVGAAVLGVADGAVVLLLVVGAPRVGA